MPMKAININNMTIQLKRSNNSHGILSILFLSFVFNQRLVITKRMSIDQDQDLALDLYITAHFPQVEAHFIGTVRVRAISLEELLFCGMKALERNRFLLNNIPQA